MNKTSKSITVITCLIVIVVALVIVAGFIFGGAPDEIIQGETVVSDYRVSSKVPARVLELRVKEGEMVRKGDTLAIMEAPDVKAKLAQAEAAKMAAEALEEKANHGARAQEIQAAYEVWQKAKAGKELAEKSFGRIDRLFQNGVMAEQKRDEVKAQMDAAIATEKAAHAQYDMAVNGARTEDKAAAAAQVRRAQGAVDEVSSYVGETVLLATHDGRVTEIFPEEGELVGTGAPIMNIAKTDDFWFTFNIREDYLKELSIGKEIEVYIPSMDKIVKARITRIKNVGNFAAWKATKALDGFDLKMFEARAEPESEVENVYAGMSAVIVR